MSSFFYFLSAVLVIGWALGFFFIGVSGNTIHFLLLIAVVAFLLGFIRRPTAA
jgi:hypothetical protein